MKDKIINFLRRSYGYDLLSKHLYFLGLALFILALILKSNIFRYTALFLMLVSLFRNFSTKRNTRYQELIAYKRLLNRLKTRYKVLILNIKNFKTHKYVVCKKCNQQLRLPRKQGKISVKCPRCHNQFDTKT